jgi:hypothetical protein
MPKAASKKVASKKVASKKAKKVKDPNAPKKARGAYMFFCQDERPKIVKAHPEMAFGDVGKELGKRWTKCTGAARKPFEAAAAKDKARYERETKKK